MTLSPTVTEWAEAYEQEHGHKPADLVLQIAEHILKVGKMLKELGQKDAQQGKCAHATDFFPALVIKAFGINHPDTVQAVAELWQSDYMDGYSSATEI